MLLDQWILELGGVEPLVTDPLVTDPPRDNSTTLQNQLCIAVTSEPKFQLQNHGFWMSYKSEII